MTIESDEPCFCDRMGLGVPGRSCGDCPTRDYKPMRKAKTSAERQREYRARLSAMQLSEVRGIYARAVDHKVIKAAAEKITRVAQ